MNIKATTRDHDDEEDEHLARAYRAAIAGVVTSGRIDAGQARATVRRDRRRRRAAAVTVAGAAALAGLIVLIPGTGTHTTAVPATTPTTSPTPTPDPTQLVDTSVMTVDPSTARPGAVVTLWFPGEMQRGLMFSLEARQNTGWRQEYVLISSTQGRPRPTPAWYRANDTDIAVPDVAVTGPGGDQVHIPDEAKAGDYRLCTLLSGPVKACTPVVINT